MRQDIDNELWEDLHRKESWQAAAIALVKRNRLTYQEICNEAFREARGGDPIKAMFECTVAAEYAWRNHPGVFASSELEGLVTSASETLKSRSSRSRSHVSRPIRPRRGRRVLHVLTAADVFGGHARWTANWILQDTESVHSVVLLRQLRQPILRVLIDAIAKCRGDIVRLDRYRGDLFQRAGRLRSLAADFDNVVLYHHPSDATVGLSFAGNTTGPKVILANHADHVFGLGIKAAHAVVNLRPSAVELALLRRGIAGDHLQMLPLPVALPRRKRERKDAKIKLGVPKDSVVLLTVGAPYKFSPVCGLNFVDLHRRIVSRDPKIIMLAVGPGNSALWAAAEEATEGRMRALGAIHDVTPYYEAADMYVEPFPFGSLTAALEAASYGCAVFSLSYPGTSLAKVTRTDDPTICEEIIAPDKEDAYVDEILECSRDTNRLSELGKRTGDLLKEFRSPAQWNLQVGKLYDAVDAMTKISRITPTDAVQEVDLLAASIAATGGFTQLEKIRFSQFRLLPLAARFAACRSVKETSFLAKLKILIPEWVVARASVF